jgi:hypothetical protein
MEERRFPKQAYRRQLKKLEDELRDWAMYFGMMRSDEMPEWLQGRLEDRYTQLLDVAHTVERARYDLDVLPRLR